MKTKNYLIFSFIILALSTILLILPTSLRAVLEHNLWSLAAAEAAFGDSQAPSPPRKPHPHAYQWLARLALQEGDPTAALDWLLYLGGEDDNFSVDDRPWVLFKAGDYPETKNLWQGIGYTGLLTDIAWAAQSDGDFELALLAYQAAYQVDPIGQTTGYANLLRRVAQYAQAEALLMDSLDIFLNADQRASWWRTLGDLYLDQDDWVNARDAYRRAISEDDQDQAAWVRLGWLVYEESGDIEAALDYFKEAIRVASTRGAGYYAIGQLLVREGQPEQALEWFQQASENEPGSLNNLLVYANLLRDTDQFELAMDEYEKAMAKWPESWYTYNHLAWAYWVYDQSEQAIWAIEKAMELNPEGLGIYLRAGLIYEASGRLEEALRAYQVALHISPEHPDAITGVERLTSGE